MSQNNCIISSFLSLFIAVYSNVIIFMISNFISSYCLLVDRTYIVGQIS